MEFSNGLLESPLVILDEGKEGEILSHVAPPA